MRERVRKRLGKLARSWQAWFGTAWMAKKYIVDAIDWVARIDLVAELNKIHWLAPLMTWLFSPQGQLITNLAGIALIVWALVRPDLKKSPAPATTLARTETQTTTYSPTQRMFERMHQRDLLEAQERSARHQAEIGTRKDVVRNLARYKGSRAKVIHTDPDRKHRALEIESILRDAEWDTALADASGSTRHRGKRGIEVFGYTRDGRGLVVYVANELSGFLKETVNTSWDPDLSEATNAIRVYVHGQPD